MTDSFLRRTTRNEEHYGILRALSFESYITVPLTARGRTLGTITLVSTDPARRYGPSDVAVAEDLARRTALTVDNARLYEAEQRARQAAERAAERTAVLQLVTAGLAEALTPEDVAEVIVKRSMDALGARAGAVALLQEDRRTLQLLRWQGYLEHRLKEFATFDVDAPLPMSDAVRQGTPVLISTTEELTERYPSLPSRMDAYRALACVPLTLEGHAVGAMSLSFEDTRSFGEEDLELLLSIGRQGAQAIERARAYEAERAARAEAEAVEKRMTLLAHASAVLAGSVVDYEATLRNVAQLAVPDFADWCVVDILTDEGSIERVALSHTDPKKVELGTRLREQYPPNPEDPSGVANVLRTGRSEMIPEITEEMVREALADQPDFLEVILELGLTSSMTVPLIARGRTLGALTFVTSESGRHYEPADLRLAEELATRAALAVDNSRLYQERSYVARTLQQTLLPPRLPAIRGIEVGALYRPAGEGTEIGGDFYDLFETTDGTWAVAIGDVCGKGADAAAVIGLVRYTIRAVAMQERRPSKVLAALNQALRQQTIGDRFCTVAYTRLRPSEEGARLTVCCGGHPMPMVLRRDGTIETIGQPGTLLGVFGDPDLTDRTADLQPGDAVLLYTDGVTEERSESEVFGEDGLRDVLASCRGQDAQAIVAAVGDAVEAFRREAPRDDMAILVLRVKA
jgi:serine phosphatase RsbU (regulator of sigma subunit)